MQQKVFLSLLAERPIYSARRYTKNGTENRYGRRGAAARYPENRRGGSAPRYGHPQKVQAGQEALGTAHHRQRAVLENAPLGADGEGRGGRQQLRPPSPQRLAGELHPLQARRRHGRLSPAHRPAP